jgi:NADH:ubiquinone oxidoreductase subunit
MIWLTAWRGTFVGQDQLGNRYYRAKPKRSHSYEQRWVMYVGEPEASTIPPEWHGWLHHQQKDPPATSNPLRRSWQKPPEPNLTGTDKAYRPPGSTLNAGYRDRATGDYEAWSPPP